MLAEDCSTKSYATDATRCPRTRRAQVIVAIRAVQDHKGASRQAIVKYLKSEFQCENGVAIKKALKSDKLIQTGQSFRVKGDAPSRRRPTKRASEDVTVGDGAVAQKGDEVDVLRRHAGGRQADGTNFRFTRRRSFSAQESRSSRSPVDSAGDARAGTEVSSACASAAAASSSCRRSWATARRAVGRRYRQTAPYCST